MGAHHRMLIALAALLSVDAVVGAAANATAVTTHSHVTAHSQFRRLAGRFKEALANANAAVAASSAAEAKTGSTTRRITRGLGVFAGNDFPCERDRDAFVGAPWSRGACLLKCGPGSSERVPRCGHAISVCERLPQCATIDINVEGSVATLKSESSLSSRTSHVKDVTVVHARSGVSIGADGPCASADARKKAVRLRGLEGLRSDTCVFDCPALNCTAGVAACFDAPTCIGVSLSFQIEGHSAVARLRYGQARPRAAGL